MKALLVGILTLNANSVSAQGLTKAQVATLLQTKKATLEAIAVGMSKTVLTTSSVSLEDGSKCDYIQSAVQSILKIEGEKMIVFSKESYNPLQTPACIAGGLQAFQEDVVFYEAKPSVTKDIQDLNESDVVTITKEGEVLTMLVNGKSINEDGTTTSEQMTVKYDLSKSSFKNLILSQSPSFKIETTDLPALDVNTVDLRDVVFCSDNEGDNSDCVRGDFSDILF